MRTFVRDTVALWLFVFTFAIAARADTLVNGFDTPFDYAANGIVGDTNWDGVYLRFGDVPGGNVGSAGAGNTPIAGTAVGPFSGFLALQNVGGNWTAAEDDGFFLYKLVQGDFDVSVESVPGSLSGGTGFDNRANNLAGLMIRSYHTNNSGAPYSTTLTNNSENNVRLWRFNEFNIDGQVRYASNASNVELNFDVTPGNNIATNDSRFFRIVRTSGTNFTFYRKTNSFDAWVQITNGLPASGILTRGDWAGQPLQVGICHAAFSTFTRDALFDNFQLSGSGVTFPAMPPAPTGLVTTATNTGGSLTFSWTTNGGNGSLVVVSTRPIQHNPVNGLTYNASSSFGNTNALIGGGGNYVVYNGPATSVTVTNLGGNSTIYRVAVFSYSTNAGAPVYNTASPATGGFNGPGLVNSAFLSVIDNDIPVNGAVTLRMTASFSTGETSDQTANTTWVSGSPAIASVDASGVVSGISSGVATITGTFGPFNPSTNITVHVPVGFTDNFATPFNYLTNALVGSPWDGLFMNFGDITGGVPGGDGNGLTTVLNAQLSNTNGLSMTSLQSDWQGTANDGPFLYKIVPGTNNSVSGDFSVITHVNTMNILNAHAVGLQARLYNPANHGAGPGGAENHVNYWKVQNGNTSVRATVGGANTTLVPAGPLAANGWLLMTRVNSTNFYFFEKTGATDPWTFVTSTVLAAASNNAPMEVGIAQQTQSGVNGIAVLDNGFFLDAAGVNPGTPPPPASGLSITLNPNLSMTLTWIAASNGVPIQSIAVMRSNAPVSAQPIYGASVTGNSVFGQGTDLGGRNYAVYVSSVSPPSTTNSVTVTGLTAGQTYYAAIYTFTGSGSTKVFNNVVPSGAAASQADGFLQGIVASLEGGIPGGGIGQLQVLANYNGIFVDISSLSTVGVSSGDTNVIKVFGGVLTGVTNGTAPIIATFSGFTNVASVTVRPPTFADGFDSNHDYLANGVAGTGWEGLYNPAVGSNPIPGSPYVPLAGSGTTIADANVSSNSSLTVTSAGDGWENAAAGGFFLFKYVPGDFQMSVLINTNDFLTSLGAPGGQNGGNFTFNQPGIMARAYGSTNGVIGAPFGTVVSANLGEYWVSLTRFDEFNIGTYARRNLNSAVTQNTQTDPADLNYWLLIKRTGGTRFDFFKRLSPNDPWRRVPNNTSYTINEFAGQPMQVGVVAGPFTGAGGTQRTVHFENFMLDVGKARLQITAAGNNALLTWAPFSGVSLQYSLGVSPTSWQSISGTPVATNGALVTVSIPITNTTSFFRLAQ